LCTVCVIVYVFINRRKKAILRTKPMYAILMLVGAIFVYSAAILKLIEPAQSQAGNKGLVSSGVWQCIIYRWSFHLGFVLFTSTFFVRMNTVNQIFSSFGAHVRSKKTGKKFFSRSLGASQAQFMALSTATSIILVTIYLFTWTYFNLPRPTALYSRYNYGDHYQIRGRYKCKMSNKNLRWMQYLIVVLELCIILFGIGLVRKNSTIKSGDFNDSRPVALSIYNGLFSQIIPMMMELNFIATDDKVINDLIESLSWWWAVTIFLLSYLTPKLLESTYEVITKISKLSRRFSSRHLDIDLKQGRQEADDSNAFIHDGIVSSSDRSIENGKMEHISSKTVELQVNNAIKKNRKNRNSWENCES
jgi:hypothetical protein